MFDFSLLDSKGNINSLIEYDGIHHFRPIIKGDKQAIDDYEKRIEHDRRKDEWCGKNGLPILRIRYTVFDRIPEIINRFLQKYYYVEANDYGSM